VTASPLTPEAPARLASWLPGYVALALIWGSSFLFIKVGIRELHPLYLGLGRAALGALTAGAILHAGGGRLPRSRALWGHVSVTAALSMSVPVVLFGYGERFVSSIVAGLWNATTPLFVLPIGVFVFGIERLTTRRSLGLVVGFAGVLVILGVWQAGPDNGLLGNVLCGAAAVCYGVSVPYQRRFLSGRSESAVAVVASQMIMASIQLAVVAPFVAGAPPAPTSLSWDVLASVVTLGTLGTGVAYAISFRMVRVAGASTASSVNYVLPIVCTLLGVMWLGERLSWYQPIGAAIALVGVVIAESRGNRTARAVPQPALVGASPVE
jgi:drug/metabolite transporter (DMT)-like permease